MITNHPTQSPRCITTTASHSSLSVQTSLLFINAVSSQHHVLATFQEKLLPEWSSTMSHPFSSLALEYVLSTVFTHLHLYQLVLNDAGVVETRHVDLTVPAPPVCAALQQGMRASFHALSERHMSFRKWPIVCQVVSMWPHTLVHTSLYPFDSVSRAVTSVQRLTLTRQCTF